MFLLKTILVVFTALTIGPAALAAETPELGAFDVFVEVGGSLGFGNYDAEGIDKGSLVNWDAGGRGGFKLGPVFAGFEYRSASPGASSDTTTISDANRIRYPLLDSGTMASLGPTIGFKFGSFFLWTSFFVNEFERSLSYNGTSYTHEYVGSGVRVELSINVYKNIHVGAYGQQFTFDEYTSNHPSDTAEAASLDPSLTGITYGFTFSYIVPLVDLVKKSLK